MTALKTELLQIVSNYFDDLKIDISGKNICVGLSGGADSVALLRSLLLLKNKYGFSVLACHFNHMIRGEEADRDEDFCKELCKNLDVKIYCGRDDVPEYARYYKLTLEEAARKCRYEFFARVAEKANVDFCATAHNMNDDAETLLFNLIRGSGSNGASSIAPLADGLLRPFLKVKREQIEGFLALLDQSYITDSTNNSLEYTRNRIRKVVFPEILKINPSAVESLSRYADTSRTDRDFFDKLVSENLNSDLRTLHKAVRSRVIIKKFKDFANIIPNRSIIMECENALMSEKRCVLHLSRNVEAITENGKIQFFNSSEIVNFDFEEQKLEIGNNKVFSERINVCITREEFSELTNFNKISTTVLLSFDNIVGDLTVRNRRIGDKIKMHGMNKSLKKLFIEKKIPKEYRSIIPIISDEQGILYVPFVGCADRVYTKNNENTVCINILFNSIDKERWVNAYEK